MNKDITPLNDKKQAHGYWEVYYSNGKLWYKCFLHNGKVVGYSEEEKEEWYSTSVSVKVIYKNYRV